MREPLSLELLRSEPLDWRFRSFPTVAAIIRIGDVAAQGWSLFESGFLFPALVLKRSALEHNLAAVARFCDERNLLLAPHGKTTMAPQLFERQLALGAWAVTAASVQHARVYRAFGVQRILLANELVRSDEARWVRAELERDPAFEFFCYADSLAGAAALGRAFAGSARPLAVLVELGGAGGRAGCRTIEEALAVARALESTRGLRLAGAGAFEGILAGDRAAPAVEMVDTFCDRLADLAHQLRTRVDGAALVTAGGSAFPDRVAQRFAARFAGDPGVRMVIRPGCYVTHDHGAYERTSPFGEQHAGLQLPRLRPALELWGAVLSRPESTRAIVGFGKRDAPFDIDLPIPLAVRTPAGATRPASSMKVVRLNDQHAYVDVAADDPIAPGDLLACGISHPCLAFDKWPLIPLVDDEYQVVDAIRTYF